MEHPEKDYDKETKVSAEKWVKLAPVYAKEFEPLTLPNALVNFQILKGLITPKGRKMKIIELGCASGLLGKVLLDCCGDLIEEYTFVDFSDAMIGMAKKNLAGYEALGTPKLRFEVLSVEKLNVIEDSHYDVAISHYCFHLVANISAAFKEAKRVIKGDGYLAISVPGNCRRSQRLKPFVEVSLEMGLLSPTSIFFEAFRFGEVKALTELGESFGLKAVHGHEYSDVFSVTSDFSSQIVPFLRPYFNPDVTDDSLNNLTQTCQALIEKESDGFHFVTALGIYCIFQN